MFNSCPNCYGRAAMLSVTSATRVLPAAKITEIRQFTPSHWAKAQTARRAQAN
jgi:hypothetical protein